MENDKMYNGNDIPPFGIKVFTRRSLIWYIGNAKNQQVFQSFQSMTVNGKHTRLFAAYQHSFCQSMFPLNPVIQSLLNLVNRFDKYLLQSSQLVVCNRITVDSCTREFVWMKQFLLATTRSTTLRMTVNQHLWVALFQLYYCRLKHAWVCLMRQFP